ncbi:MAG: ricin-type beta-trefoil lectin domain protein [Saprospiraceae bacterium]
MKDKNNFFKRFSRIVSILVLFCYGSTVQLFGQQTTFQYDGQYHDYVIPQTDKQYILLTAVGGDGGRIHFKNLLTDFQVGGGRGGLLKAYFKIGNEPNNLKPGSTLRFIVGESGESRLTAGNTGAGGGGGTGIAYKEAGTQKWTLLMVAGGGGGGAHDLIMGRNTGEPSPAYIEGEEGDGKGGNSYATVGGGAGAYGDDEYFVPGSGANSSTLKYKYGEHAKAGWSGGPDSGEPIGGDCVNTGPQGGWGFGAGGDGDATSAYPGGGGGYTGGDAGDADGASATGGTSYLNTSMQTILAAPIERGTTTSPENGSAFLELADSPLSIIRFTYNTNKCIDDYGSSTSNGTNIQTYTCTGNPNQQWYLNAEDRTISSKLNTAKCLDLDNSNTNNGTNIQLYDCNGSSAQKWVYNGLYKTIHSGVNSDKCFDAKDASKAINLNVNLQLWDCNYTSKNQKWEIDGATAVSNLSNMKHIVPVSATGFAVHSHTGAESGSNIQLWTKDNINTAEQWYFDGLAIKMRDHQNLCIDLSQSNNIQLYDCNGTNAQKWLYDGMNRSIRSVVNPDKCMQIEKNTDGAYGKRSNVEIHDCNGSAAQQFLIQE